MGVRAAAQRPPHAGQPHPVRPAAQRAVAGGPREPRSRPYVTEFPDPGTRELRPWLRRPGWPSLGSPPGRTRALASRLGLPLALGLPGLAGDQAPTLWSRGSPSRSCPRLPSASPPRVASVFRRHFAAGPTSLGEERTGPPQPSRLEEAGTGRRTPGPAGLRKAEGGLSLRGCEILGVPREGMAAFK